jgi:ABC-type multidrug transport system permease subunit
MRNKMVVKVRVAQVIVFSLLLDLIFNRIPDRDVNAQVQDRVGSLFFVIVNMVLAFAMGNLAIFIVERVVFEREYRAGMYGLPAYFFSKSLVDLPFLFLLPAIYAALTYFCVGYQLEVGKFFNFLATVFLLANVGTGLGLFAAASFPNLTIALMSVPMLVLPFMIFAGLFVNLATLPVWIRWFKWLSPMKYGYVAFVKNEFTGLQIPCPTGSPPGCVIPGETIIERYGMSDQGSIAVNLIALTGFLVLFWSLAFLGLYRTVTFGNASVKQVKADAHAQLLKKTT